MILTIVEGTTKPKQLQLTDDEAAVNAAGLDAPALVLTDRDGKDRSVSNVTSWVTAASGIFEVDLGSLALHHSRSPYRARFILTDASSDTAAYPDTETGDEWRVVKQ